MSPHHRTALSLRAAAITLITAASANAGVSIEFTGLDLVYDGSALYDAGSNSGGVANPADADALVSLDFFNNNTLVGSLSSDIALDIFIPDLTNIPSAANTVYNTTTPGNPGFFDLLIGTSPLASEFLIVDLTSVNITYLDIAGVAQFTFAGAISSNIAQNLPFGLVADEPVTISFSTQIVPGSITSDDGIITGFNAFGTGEYQSIPAPAAAVLLGASGLTLARNRRRGN